MNTRIKIKINTLNLHNASLPSLLLGQVSFSPTELFSPLSLKRGFPQKRCLFPRRVS